MHCYSGPPALVMLLTKRDYSWYAGKLGKARFQMCLIFGSQLALAELQNLT